MKSYLKKETVRIEALGEDLELTGLSTAAHVEIDDARSEDWTKWLVLTCKHGVIDWNKESVEDIAANVPSMALNEIARHVYRLSGVDLAKNSESVTEEDSSSA